MKKNKGFTLIELLAVIIILSIVALIIVPVIMNIIEKANRSAFKDSAYGVIKAAELYYTNKLLEPNVVIEEISFSFPEADGLDIKGTKPTGGSMKINKKGKIELAITNGKYCATKGLNEDDVKISNNVKNCIIPIEIKDLKIEENNIQINTEEEYTLKVNIEPSSATNKELKITSLDEKIVKVENGKLIGVGKGTVKVIVETLDGSNIKKEVNVTVNQSVTSIEVDNINITLNIGETKIVTATPKPDDAKDKELIWKSNDESIATVNNGVITAINTGTTKVIVTSSSNTKIKKEINVTVKEPILTSANSCIKTGTCSNGTLVNVKVNDTTSYNFYVINDDGNYLTLIMDRNLGEKVASIIQEDYEAAGGTNWGNNGNVEKGPLTILKKLKERTNDWTNIESFDYTLEDDKVNAWNATSINYQPIKVTDIKARILSGAEAQKLGCTAYNGSCPSYLTTNLSNSYYWTSTTGHSNIFMTVSTDKCFSSDSIYTNGGYTNNYIRPVIKVKK